MESNFTMNHIEKSPFVFLLITLFAGCSTATKSTPEHVETNTVDVEVIAWCENYANDVYSYCYKITPQLLRMRNATGESYHEMTMRGAAAAAKLYPKGKLINRFPVQRYGYISDIHLINSACSAGINNAETGTPSEYVRKVIQEGLMVEQCKTHARRS